MKKYLILSIAFLTYLSASIAVTAQEFKPTDAYTITNERSLGQEEEGVFLVDIVPSADPSKTIATVQVADRDVLSGVQLTLLANPGLEDVSEILKVAFVYNACCTSTETHYVLVKSDDDFIALPSIVNLYCDTLQEDTRYIFPSQAYGAEGSIRRAAITYTETFSIKAVEVLQSIVWNDDDFDNEDAITAID